MWMSIMQTIIRPVLSEECKDLYGTVFVSSLNLIKGKPLQKGRVGTTSGIFTAVQGDSESALAEKS